MSESIDVIRAGLAADCCDPDPHVEALFQLTADIANGVDPAIAYMVNDFGEILINGTGQLLEE